MTDYYAEQYYVNCNHSGIVVTKQDIVACIWGWENNLWTPDDTENPLPTGGTYIRLRSNSYPLLKFVDVSLLIESTNDNAPLLAISQGLVVKKDLAVGGFLSANQGLIALCSGHLNCFDPPGIWLSNSSGRPLQTIQESSTPPTGDLTDGQCYINTNNNHLYQYNSSSWVDEGHIDNYNYYFDTCYIRKAGYTVPLPFANANIPIADADLGNLACSDVNAIKLILRNSPYTVTLLAGGTSQSEKYIYPTDTNETVGLGATDHYFKWVDASYVKCNYLAPLDSAYIKLCVPLTAASSDPGALLKSYYGGGTVSQGGITMESQNGNFYFDGGHSGCYWHVDRYSTGTPILQVWWNGYISVPQTLSSSGVVYSNGDGTLYNSGSARRYKDNIISVEDCSWIYDLNPVTFYWVNDQQKLRGSQQEIGLIAEDVNTVCSLLTWTNNSGQIEGVKYEKLAVPMLVEMKKLRDRIAQLEKQLKQNT